MDHLHAGQIERIESQGVGVAAPLGAFPAPSFHAWLEGAEPSLPHVCEYSPSDDYSWLVDPRVLATWMQRKTRRIAIRVLAWLAIVGAMAFVGWLVHLPSARDALASWVTMGRVAPTSAVTPQHPFGPWAE